MNRIIFIFLFCLLFSCELRSQKIVYDLPGSVIAKAKEYLDKYDKSNDFIVQLSKQDSNRYILFIINYDFSNLDEFKLIEDFLIKKTYRVVRIDDETFLPLITDEDFLFADFGTVKTKDGRIAKKKIVFTSESFPITFDRSGRIY